MSRLDLLILLLIILLLLVLLVILLGHVGFSSSSSRWLALLGCSLLGRSTSAVAVFATLSLRNCLLGVVDRLIAVLQVIAIGELLANGSPAFPRKLVSYVHVILEF
jgi:hypothetical protein